MKKMRFIVAISFFILTAFAARAQQMRARWVIPDEVDFQDKAFITESAGLDIKIDILTGGTRLDASEVTLLRNGYPYKDPGQKELERISMKAVSEDHFRLEKQIVLPEGESVWEVEALLNGKTQKIGKPMRILWNAGKPNLYIICVGVPYELKYAQNDAADVFALFKTQQGQLFGNVRGELLICDETTSRGKIAQTIANLRAERLTSKDMVILFFSGHGKPTESFGGTDFGLVTNDAKQGVLEDELVLLSYQQNIIRYIEPLPCKRIIMLDACHSGVAGGAKSWSGNFKEAQMAIASTPSGIVTISSSSGSESSYEDDSWKHGAFTHALLAGLQGSADGDKNGTITIVEISDYLSEEVPRIVDATKKRSQHPWLVKKPKADFPLFNYRHMNAFQAMNASICAPPKSVAPDLSRPATAQRRIAVAAGRGNAIDAALTSKIIGKLKVPLADYAIGRADAKVLRDPGSDAHAERVCIIRRLSTIYRQEAHNGYEFWVAQVPLEIDFYNPKTGENEYSFRIEGKYAQGADRDKSAAEENALEAALGEIENHKFEFTN